MGKEHTVKTYTDENPGGTHSKSEDMIIQAINYLKNIDIQSMNLNRIKIILELESVTDGSEKTVNVKDPSSRDLEAKLGMGLAIIQNSARKMNPDQLNTFINTMIHHMVLYFGRKRTLEALVLDDIELSHETVLPGTLNRAFKNLDLGFMIEYLKDESTGTGYYYVKKVI